jgi:2-dehydro-3-deoxyphosphogalactonate aldolase
MKRNSMTATHAPTDAALRAPFDAAMASLPLVAILRGLAPTEAVSVAQALYGAGLRLIEVPLNSPEPLLSIASIRGALPGDALVGAGTVLGTEAVAQVQAAGGQIIVMPHADTQVIRAAKAAGLLCVPGVATPTEAFAALAAGADALKLFPAELVTPAVLKAMKAVLPRDVALLPVGGITPQGLREYRQAGAAGFGLGSALFRPGLGVAAVRDNALAFVAAWRALSAV